MHKFEHAYQISKGRAKMQTANEVNVGTAALIKTDAHMSYVMATLMFIFGLCLFFYGLGIVIEPSSVGKSFLLGLGSIFMVPGALLAYFGVRMFKKATFFKQRIKTDPDFDL